MLVFCVIKYGHWAPRTERVQVLEVHYKLLPVGFELVRSNGTRADLRLSA
jgi:hypothetical protein